MFETQATPKHGSGAACCGAKGTIQFDKIKGDNVSNETLRIYKATAAALVCGSVCP